MLDRARGARRRPRRLPRAPEARTSSAPAELYFSEAVLLALVETGMARQEAYVLRAAQRDARAGRATARSATNLAADADVSAKLSKEKLDELFDLDHALQHVPGIVERALAPSA